MKQEIKTCEKGKEWLYGPSNQPVPHWRTLQGDHYEVIAVLVPCQTVATLTEQKDLLLRGV